MNLTTVLKIFLCLMLSGSITVGCSKNTFTGIYIADSRPNEITYMSLTQTENSVSGSMVVVQPDKQGGTKSFSMAVKGTIDGNTLTMAATTVLVSIQATGRKKGENIELLILDHDGTMSNILFKPTSENEYNLAVSQWQDELGASYKKKAWLEKIEQEKLAAREEELAIRKNEIRNLEKLAEEFSHYMEIVKSTGIPRNIDELGTALGSVKSALLTLEKDLEVLKGDVSVRPMTCYQAFSTADYTYRSTMAYSYDSNLRYAYDKFIRIQKELEGRLSNVDSAIAFTIQAANSLKQAMDESKYPAPELSVLPGDEKPVLHNYREIAASAQTDLQMLKATLKDIMTKAKLIMEEGKSILKATQQSVNCD